MSTVNCNLVLADGSARALTVTFTPLSNPQVLGTQVVLKEPKSLTTAADGTGSLVLEPGNYKVEVSDGSVFKIAVPNDSLAYSLSSLITNAAGWSLPSYGETRFTSLQLAIGNAYYKIALVLVDGSPTLQITPV